MKAISAECPHVSSMTGQMADVGVVAEDILDIMTAEAKVAVVEVVVLSVTTQA